MSLGDVLLLVIRWLHALAAVAWIGGGIFYLLVLRPNLSFSDGNSQDGARAVGEQFRSLVTTAIAVLLVTGTILSLSRLSSGYAGTSYVIVLIVKIILALYMFYLVRFLRHRTYPAESALKGQRFQRITDMFSGATSVLVIGVIVFLLADILRALIEKGIEG